MTGFFEANLYQPLSLVTIAALDDIEGYTVDYCAADIFPATDETANSGRFPVQKTDEDHDYNIENLSPIDIDEATAQEAQINAQSSPFSERLNIQHCALQNFSPKENFDLIVSNPPYFRKTTKSNNRRRALARDNETLNLEYLIEKSYDLLSNNGNLSLVTPAYEFEIIEAIAQNKGFFITRICWVKGNNNSPTKRVLINLSKKKDQVKENYLTIEKSRHNFTEEYRDLCKNFYAKI